MEHLSVEQIIEFISMDTLAAGDLALSREVNTHLTECGECRRMVRAAQAVYDALLAECKSRELARERLDRRLQEELEQNG